MAGTKRRYEKRVVASYFTRLSRMKIATDCAMISVVSIIVFILLITREGINKF